MLSSEKNLYEILEISASSGPHVIKAAYRRLVRKYHPDLNNGDEACAKKFKEVTEAYEILSDSEKKKNYDILRGFYYADEHTVKQKQANRAYKETQRDPRKDFSKYSGRHDFNSSRFTNVFNDILEGFKHSSAYSTPKQPQPERGKDVFADVTVSVHEAAIGTSRTVNILHTQKCPHCGGRKFINGAKCHICNGSGEQAVHKKLLVKIPSGVKNGSKIRIANEGNSGYNGGKNGDLYLKIKVENNSFFKYEGLNVLCTIPITPYEAVLGATIVIPSVDGNIAMKILPNTNSGQKFRLSGQGIKTANGENGDMIVTINIEIPKNISKREKELYEELKECSGDNVRENLINGT